MPEQAAGEKSLPASQRKRERARQEGNIPRSQDLSAAITLLAALLAMEFLGPFMFRALIEAGRYYFGSFDVIVPEVHTAQWIAVDMLRWTAICVLPIMLFLMLGGVAVNLLQVGFLFAPTILMPKLDRVNPLSGFKKFVNLRAFVELVKSILKLTLVTYIVWVTVRHRTEELLVLMQLSPLEAGMVLSGIVMVVWWRVVLAILILGILDFGFQRWQYDRDLMMTVQEAREEARELEGDPRIKQRIRQVQRQMATRRMMAEVPEAEVVVTNPTTYAVALRYDPGRMDAPVVVAKGARLIAERIRQLAVQHDVPVIERPDLARTLYRTVEIGQPVPENLFRAVAEILAYVYRIDRRAAKLAVRGQMAPQGA